MSPGYMWCWGSPGGGAGEPSDQRVTSRSGAVLKLALAHPDRDRTVVVPGSHGVNQALWRAACDYEEGSL